MSRPQPKYVASRVVAGPQVRRMGPRRYAYHKPVYPRSSMGTFLRRAFFVGLALFALGLAATFIYKLWVDRQTAELIYKYNEADLPHSHVAIVFGAGLNAAGGPSAMLYDRVATGVDLYNNNKADKLLMTGDNSTVNYNEVEVMRQTALNLGVPDADIVLDYAGFSTWDSCYRAREVFSLTEATLVTQRFHLPRALHTCNLLKVDSVGVTADRQPYPTFGNEVRELPALAATVFRALVNDKPKFLGPKVNVDEVQPR